MTLFSVYLFQDKTKWDFPDFLDYLDFPRFIKSGKSK